MELRNSFLQRLQTAEKIVDLLEELQRQEKQLIQLQLSDKQVEDGRMITNDGGDRLKCILL